MKKILPFGLIIPFLFTSCSWWGTSRTANDEIINNSTGSIRDNSGTSSPLPLVETSKTGAIDYVSGITQSTGTTTPSQKTDPFSGDITPFVNDVPVGTISWSTDDIGSGSTGNAEVDESLKEISTLLNDISGSTTTGSTKK